MKTFRLGIIGCGDFLRFQAPGILRSKNLQVAAVYDPDAERAKKYAGELKTRVAGSAEELIADPEVDLVGVFVPPWARKPLILRAATAGKHIITTKPLAPTIADCDEMIAAVRKAGVYCGVIYNRTESPVVEALKAAVSFRKGWGIWRSSNRIGFTTIRRGITGRWILRATAGRSWMQ